MIPFFMKNQRKKPHKGMQKKLLLGLLLFASLGSYAQQATYHNEGDQYRRGGLFGPEGRLRMGFQISPVLSSNRVEGAGNMSSFSNDGPALRLSVGPVADYFFSDKYAFSTGLWYTVKRAAFTNSAAFSGLLNPSLAATVSAFNLQYLQVPLTFKLYTNELAPYLRGYMHFGALGEIKLSEKPLSRDVNPLYQFTQSQGRNRSFGPVDASLLLGLGTEYQYSQTDVVYLGLSYQRGLVNVTRSDQLRSRSSGVLLNVGIRF